MQSEVKKRSKSEYESEQKSALVLASWHSARPAGEQWEESFRARPGAGLRALPSFMETSAEAAIGDI